MSDEQKIAIILHGPPTTGKTTISSEICRRMAGEARWIHLDQGWGGPGDPKDRSKESGYSDIQNARERVLILELADGEPSDPNVKGATRGAERWARLLREDGRELFAYLLSRNWPDAVRRLVERHEGNFDRFLAQLRTYVRYHASDRPMAFPAAAGLNEHEIVTSGRTVDEVVNEIMMRSGLF